MDVIVLFLMIFALRLGDYPAQLKSFGGKPVDMAYFEAAMTSLKQKHDNIAFLVVSDEIESCRLKIVLA